MHVACWALFLACTKFCSMFFFLNSANQSSVGDTAMSVLDPISFPCLSVDSGPITGLKEYIPSHLNAAQL